MIYISPSAPLIIFLGAKSEYTKPIYPGNLSNPFVVLFESIDSLNSCIVVNSLYNIAPPFQILYVSAPWRTEPPDADATAYYLGEEHV